MPIMLLPNYERAVIDDGKLVDYALNPDNERGQHKARVFQSALGFNLSNWQQLRQAILEALSTHQATFIRETEFGRKFEVILLLRGPNGQLANVITIWQYDYKSDRGAYSDVPRLITLYVP